MKLDANAQGLADLEITRSYHRTTHTYIHSYNNNIPHSLSFRLSISFHVTHNTPRRTWLSRESTRSLQILVGMSSHSSRLHGHPCARPQAEAALHASRRNRTDKKNSVTHPLRAQQVLSAMIWYVSFDHLIAEQLDRCTRCGHPEVIG